MVESRGQRCGNRAGVHCRSECDDESGHSTDNIWACARNFFRHRAAAVSGPALSKVVAGFTWFEYSLAQVPGSGVGDPLSFGVALDFGPEHSAAHAGVRR